MNYKVILYDKDDGKYQIGNVYSLEGTTYYPDILPRIKIDCAITGTSDVIANDIIKKQKEYFALRSAYKETKEKYNKLKKKLRELEKKEQMFASLKSEVKEEFDWRY